MTRLTVLGTSALSALALTACGGGGDDTNNPDASHQPQIDSAPQPDAPPACTAITLGAQDISGVSDIAGVWHAPVTTDLGDGGDPILQMEFWDLDAGGPTVGDNDLSAAPNDDYATCTSCFIVISPNADGSAQRLFFQRTGNVNLTEDPAMTHNLAGTLDTGVILEEVEIDNQFHSTPVPGGQCLTVTTATALAHDAIPNAWTCPDTAWTDGAACDCVCGVSDPDCADTALPVNGCTGTQVCYADACRDRPTNDTCQTYTQVEIGTPINGSTIGATSNYDAGLESAGCTGFAQPGNDVAYRVTLTAGQAITVTLSNLTFDGAVAILRRGAPAVCDANPVQCQAGADAGGNGADETFQFTATQAGNYWIIVDAYNTSQQGDFTLTVTSP